MSKIRVKRGNIDRSDLTRALLTDTNPDDIPIIISNDGFHSNIRRESNSAQLKEILDALIRDNRERYTIPYRFRIRLSSTTSRQISLLHPAAQFRACAFYGNYAHLIPYFCRNNDVSLRSPSKIGSTIFYLSGISGKKRYKGAAVDVLLQDQTVRNPGSFFAYAGYDRLYKFFASNEFVRLEKTFSTMRLTDIAKCFSSIYTHTAAWAVKDVQHGKENTSAVSFANDFDRLMQWSNYNETNGIPVGAELSRIFAEIVLQTVDLSLLRKAEDIGLKHGHQFALRRYVDDYIIFAHDQDTLDSIQRGLVESLNVFNLHLNEHKTHTVCRPLQTQKSQIISQATEGLSTFKDRVVHSDKQRKVHIALRVRNASSLLRSFVNDMKTSCVNANAGYEAISPYIIGSISNTIESLIESYQSGKKLENFARENYIGAFEALLSALYFFFTVHVTVPASYQVAKCTILSIRFFQQRLPDFSEALHEVIRLLIEELITNPTLQSVNMADCVPVEVMNIVLASSELRDNYRINMDAIRKRVLENERIDYFSYVSLLFYYQSSDGEFIADVENQLERQFLLRASPRVNSHDAHFMLDLVACPYLRPTFRRKVLAKLRASLELSAELGAPLSLLREIQAGPWFVNWKEIDLLNHLRKKELSVAY